MAIAPSCNLLMNLFCIYMTACNIQLAIRCNICCMILFSIVTAGNLLVNGWLSYMMLAPTYSSDSFGGVGLSSLSNALSSLSNLAGTSGLSATLPTESITGGFSLLPNSSFQIATRYMAPICIMIGVLTLFGNIFYGVYVCKMRNLQNSNTSIV